MLRELAEYPNSFIPVRGSDERIEGERYTLCLTARHTTVQRQRFPVAELDAVLAEVRALLRERDRTETQWEVGSAAAHLVAPLLERGLTRDDDPVALAMALDREPTAPAPAGLEVRRAANAEEYAQAVAVQTAGFGGEASAERLEAARAEWDPESEIMHAVWLDGEMVCAGRSRPVAGGFALFGGATIPHARGRGAYRALIAERWRYAVAAGAPLLVTQAGALSRPILERLGFRGVGRVEMLRDRIAAPRPNRTASS